MHALILAVLLSLAGAAAAQGTLMLYTTTPEEYMRRLTVDFEKQHAIKVNIWRARSEAISQRVISEARAGTHVVDVIQSIAPSVEGGAACTVALLISTLVIWRTKLFARADVPTDQARQRDAAFSLEAG